MKHVLALLLCCACAPAGLAQTQSLNADQQLLREIFQQLIELNTTDSVGNCTVAAEAMAARLKAAGFDEVQVLGPNPRKGNLVARLKGTGARKPLLLLAHLDVVEAKREDWSFDPFAFLEKDGFYYGRGTTDDKAMAAIFVANLLRYKREGFTPDRDIIVALTADEEGGNFNGVDWLLKQHPQLLAAEFGLNEGGGGALRQGQRLFNTVQASEKVYQSFQLEIKGPGGHSSRPGQDNVIYRLAAALGRLAQFAFPVKLNEVTKAYFARVAEIEGGATGQAMREVLQGHAAAAATLSALPAYNATLRTTCVATMLAAGHAENALPQTARATVNCRILPTETAAEVQQTLTRVIHDPGIRLTPLKPPKPSPPSPLRADVLGALERVTQELWPGVPVVPTMSTGATDSLYLRKAGIPMYGTSGIFGDLADSRAHGRDERIGSQALYEAQEYLYRLVKLLAAPEARPPGR